MSFSLMSSLLTILMASSCDSIWLRALTVGYNKTVKESVKLFFTTHRGVYNFVDPRPEPHTHRALAHGPQ